MDRSVQDEMTLSNTGVHTERAGFVLKETNIQSSVGRTTVASILTHDEYYGHG